MFASVIEALKEGYERRPIVLVRFQRPERTENEDFFRARKYFEPVARIFRCRNQFRTQVSLQGTHHYLFTIACTISWSDYFCANGFSN